MRLLALGLTAVLLTACSANLRRSEGRVLDASDSRWLEQRLASEIAERSALITERSWSPPQILARLDGEVLSTSPLQAAISEALLSHGVVVHADPQTGDARMVVTLTCKAGPDTEGLRMASYIADAELRSADGVVLDIIRLQIDKRWKPQPKWK